MSAAGIVGMVAAAYVAAVRAIFLKGAGLDVLWPQVLVLFLMGGSILWLAAKRFHKTTA